MLVISDITALRKLETVRRDFVANVSHELRTPTTIIQANAETLVDGAIEDPEQAAIFLDGIYRHSQRLAHLVSDLLDLSRIESGAYQLKLGWRHPLTRHQRGAERCGARLICLPLRLAPLALARQRHREARVARQEARVPP